MGTEKGWVFYDDAEEAIEDGIARQTMGYYVADAERDARAAFWIRGDAERYVRERNRERAAGFVLSIRLGDAAMKSAEDVGTALEELAQAIADGERDGNVFDENGNVVGHWTLNEPEPPTEGRKARNVEEGSRIKIGDTFERVEAVGTMPGGRVEIITEPYSEGTLHEGDALLDVLVEEEV
jgi:hypothetical protein